MWSAAAPSGADRGGAAAGDVDIPRRRVAATPRLRRGHSVKTGPRLRYGDVNGRHDLRQAVADYYNHWFRQGEKGKDKPSYYSAANVAIVSGGRAGLSRLMCSLHNCAPWAEIRTGRDDSHTVRLILTQVTSVTFCRTTRRTRSERTSTQRRRGRDLAAAPRPRSRVSVQVPAAPRRIRGNRADSHRARRRRRLDVAGVAAEERPPPRPRRALAGATTLAVVNRPDVRRRRRLLWSNPSNPTGEPVEGDVLRECFRRAESFQRGGDAAAATRMFSGDLGTSRSRARKGRCSSWTNSTPTTCTSPRALGTRARSARCRRRSSSKTSTKTR